MALDGLSQSGVDLVGLMLRVAGIADEFVVDEMDGVRATFLEVSQALDRLKHNHDMVAEMEQDKLLISYKGFLLQSAHEIEELRKKYNVENLKLMYNQTFRSLEKAFMSLKAESKPFFLKVRLEAPQREGQSRETNKK